MNKDFRKILIIKPSSLGDIVHTLPALTALRKSFPKAVITWLVRPAFAPLIEKHPHLDQIIFFERKFLGTAWYNPIALWSLVELIARLRREKFDLVIDLQGLLRTALLAWLTGSKKRFGMSNAREFAPLFYSNRIPQTPDTVHVVNYYRSIINAAGAACGDVDFIIPISADAKQQVNLLLHKHGMDNCPYAVLVPGSTLPEKNWPIANYAAVADMLASKFALRFVAVGTGNEKQTVAQLSNIAKTEILNLAGQTTLKQLVALLKNAAIVISNDTGPGHIAAALGISLVQIFGPTNPARVGPYGRNNCTAALDPNDRGQKLFSPEYKIEDITIQQVYQAAYNQLTSQSGQTHKCDLLR
ncbi:MAG: lipopolysaccharide heptosyltransferase I [Planctomycetota bacterium]